MTNIRPLKFVVALIGGTWEEKREATAHIEGLFPGEVATDSYYAHQVDELHALIGNAELDFTSSEPNDTLTLNHVLQRNIAEALKEVLFEGRNADMDEPLPPNAVLSAYAYVLTEEQHSTMYWTGHVAEQAQALIGPQCYYNPAPPPPDKRPRVLVVQDVDLTYQLLGLEQALHPDLIVIPLLVKPTGDRDLDSMAVETAIYITAEVLAELAS